MLIMHAEIPAPPVKLSAVVPGRLHPVCIRSAGLHSSFLSAFVLCSPSLDAHNTSLKEVTPGCVSIHMSGLVP